MAAEQEETFASQKKAALIQRDLEEAKARADRQATLTQSDVDITIAENQGKADAIRAQQTANQMKFVAEGTAAKSRLEAEGQAQAIRSLAEAEAARIEKVGEATAKAAQLQVDAMGGPEYRLQQEIATLLTQAIREAELPIVPQIQVSGDQQSSGISGLLTALLGNKLVEKKSESA